MGLDFLVMQTRVIHFCRERIILQVRFHMLHGVSTCHQGTQIMYGIVKVTGWADIQHEIMYDDEHEIRVIKIEYE